MVGIKTSVVAERSQRYTCDKWYLVVNQKSAQRPFSSVLSGSDVSTTTISILSGNNPRLFRGVTGRSRASTLSLIPSDSKGLRIRTLSSLHLHTTTINHHHHQSPSPSITITIITGILASMAWAWPALRAPPQALVPQHAMRCGWDKRL